MTSQYKLSKKNNYLSYALKTQDLDVTQLGLEGEHLVLCLEGSLGSSLLTCKEGEYALGSLTSFNLIGFTGVIIHGELESPKKLKGHIDDEIYSLCQSLIHRKWNSSRCELILSFLWDFHVLPASNMQIEEDIRDYIRAHLAENLNVNSVCENFGKSRTFLNHFFREKENCSPSEYINELRMTKAKELIEQTEDPIQKIALSIGFQQDTTFSRAFKKRFGLSPKKHKESMKWLM